VSTLRGTEIGTEADPCAVSEAHDTLRVGNAEAHVPEIPLQLLGQGQEGLLDVPVTVGRGDVLRATSVAVMMISSNTPPSITDMTMSRTVPMSGVFRSGFRYRPGRGRGVRTAGSLRVATGRGVGGAA